MLLQAEDREHSEVSSTVPCQNKLDVPYDAHLLHHLPASSVAGLQNLGYFK